ncbi:tyrosyl-DNA phosphodiesterase [Acidovorax sp. 93]|uniref:hypothetical protein n=1 Tax=Acidovorax sp. 93 TaxID=2135632 RepID=UPI000F288B45|nr:hypothetical protein [Acidovorax sp. 93]RKR26774.1 tyrosyl-DNA phosphodiesterase [Acidovorax sp. 93]
MTSFEPPDAGLLVEHLLPSLLGLNRLFSQEMQERTLFFGELSTELEALHGRLNVISSPAREERDVCQYPWLWRYVSHFTVGANSRAVQHAKLWAFHWQVDGAEVLELHVSSTNLTASAFKGQVQAGWRAILDLCHPPSEGRRRTWGNLVPFLDALGVSAGTVASDRVQRLVRLLGCVQCPAETTFIASIPGTTSAARQLKQFEPSQMHMLAPTIGEWNDGTLMNWSKDVGVDPSKLRLKWIPEGHSWANPNWWSLSKSALKVLANRSVRLDCLQPKPRFIAEHQDGDNRWSHAKLYLIVSRRRRYLLVTSANWSASAWGAGKLPPRNFELGVVFETNWRGLEDVGQKFVASSVPYCSCTEPRTSDDPQLQWVEATWDGKHIELHARSADDTTLIDATIRFSDGTQKQISVIGRFAICPWNDAQRTPIVVRFTQAYDALEADVIDLRVPSEFSKTSLPEIDPDLATALREAFLLQRYGGPVVDVDSIPGLNSASRPVVAAPSADYSVQEWVDARAAFRVIDRWCHALDEAKAELTLLDRVRWDGQELCRLYARREGPAAGLVVEELGWRIEEEA